MESKDLVVCMESLALVICNVSRVEPSFCIWVMKEYGDVDSWSKHFNIDFSSFGGGFTRPLWVRKNGEVIAVSEDGRLICYDLDGEEIRDLGVRGLGCEDYRRSLHVDGFMESLVLLERGRNFSDVITCNRLPTLQGRECDETCSYASDYEQCSESDYKHRQGSYGEHMVM
ncbi:hypothetical protein ACJIZ3_007296 [Penstemon smallii]|uniref:F-box associated domain-containing protein n=1 Tax=Penstemon smallii TaxID=265156 RepID=A0ABD3SA49_9LAMI